MKPETTFATALTAIYLILSFVGIMHHELWLDESHHWLLARDSGSVSELFINTSREGHPLLWSLLLFVITRVTPDPFGMQLLHITISAAAVFVFLRKSPFSPVFKILFVFGYFMFFEYNLISRNYVLGLLFLFLACSAIIEGKRFMLIAIYLSLLANVHLMFAFIAAPMFLFAAIAEWKNRRGIRQNYPGYIIFILALTALSWQVLRTDSNWFFTSLPHESFVEKTGKGFISLFKGLAAVPDFRTIHFWNSNLFVNLSRPLAAVICLAFYGLPFILLDNKQSKIFCYMAFAGLQIFFFVTQRGATRFDGAMYLTVIASIWIDRILLSPHKPSYVKIRFRKFFLISVAVIQCLSGITAYIYDLNYPFSGAKAASSYLKQERLLSRDVLSVTCDGTMISTYIEKKVFFLCDGNYMSFCPWDFGCAQYISKTEIKKMIDDYMQLHKKAVYVSGYPIDDATISEWQNAKSFRFRFLFKTGDAILRNTSFYIYDISKR